MALFVVYVDIFLFVQVAGCLIYYILSNGHHPFEATSPYMNDTRKLINNVQDGKFSLLHVENYPAQCGALLTRMLDQDMLKRPQVGDCLKEMNGKYLKATATYLWSCSNILTNEDSIRCKTQNNGFGAITEAERVVKVLMIINVSNRWLRWKWTVITAEEKWLWLYQVPKIKLSETELIHPK